MSADIFRTTLSAGIVIVLGTYSKVTQKKAGVEKDRAFTKWVCMFFAHDYFIHTQSSLPG